MAKKYENHMMSWTSHAPAAAERVVQRVDDCREGGTHVVLGRKKIIYRARPWRTMGGQGEDKLQEEEEEEREK